MAETLAQRYARFGASAVDLLATGPAWARTQGAHLSDFVTALVREFARVEEAADAYRIEMDPSQTLALMPEWERALSLPGPCGRRGGLDAQRAAIIGRLSGGGTNDFVALQRLVAAFDSTTTLVSISHPTQFEVGTDGGGAGQPIGADAWANVITLHIETANGALDVAGLECVVNGLRRAHGYYLYDYTMVSPGGSARITQGGDTRITQGGDTRITQGI